jgi:hypothetical protein
MATAEAPAGGHHDGSIELLRSADDILVHVFAAANLPQPRLAVSAHVLLLCAGCAVRTHNARVRPDGSVRWDAAVVLPNGGAAARAVVTVCVLTGGSDPVLLGQTTLTVQCVLPTRPVLRGGHARRAVAFCCLTLTWLCFDTATAEHSPRAVSPCTTGALDTQPVRVRS